MSFIIVCKFKQIFYCDMKYFCDVHGQFQRWIVSAGFLINNGKDNRSQNRQQQDTDDNAVPGQFTGKIRKDTCHSGDDHQGIGDFQTDGVGGFQIFSCKLIEDIPLFGVGNLPGNQSARKGEHNGLDIHVRRVKTISCTKGA